MPAWPLNRTLFMVLKLSCLVRHLWIDKSITQFSFPPSGPWVLAVKLTLYLWTTKALSLEISSRLCLVRHLWTDRCPDFILPFVVISSSSPLNDKTSSPVTPNQLCPVRHLWTINVLSLVISNRLCPVRHLWTDEYPNLIILFVVMSSSSPLNDKGSESSDS